MGKKLRAREWRALKNSSSVVANPAQGPSGDVCYTKDLPNEVPENISKHLDTNDQKSLRLVSKSFGDIVSRVLFWSITIDNECDYNGVSPYPTRKNEHIQLLKFAGLPIASRHVDGKSQKALILVDKRCKRIISPILFRNIIISRYTDQVFPRNQFARERLLGIVGLLTAKLIKSLTLSFYRDDKPVVELTEIGRAEEFSACFRSLQELKLQVEAFDDATDPRLDDKKVVAQAYINQLLCLSAKLNELTVKFSGFVGEFSRWLNRVSCPQLDMLTISGRHGGGLRASQQQLVQFVLHATRLKYIRFQNVCLTDEADWERCLNAIKEGCKLDSIECAVSTKHPQWEALALAFDHVFEIEACSATCRDQRAVWTMRWEAQSTAHDSRNSEMSDV